MATRYKAIRACFYGPPGYHTLFNVGDFLTEGWEPNHHFVPEHSFEGGADDAILGSGDDPRSTKKIASGWEYLIPESIPFLGRQEKS